MAGRPRKPRAQMELEGNPGGKPLRNEPKAPEGYPICPVALTPYAKRCFHFICEQLKAMNCLSLADSHEIAIAAASFAEFIACYRAGDNWYRAAETYHKVACQLGLNPVSRARLVATAPEPRLTDAETRLQRYGIKPLSIVNE